MLTHLYLSALDDDFQKEQVLDTIEVIKRNALTPILKPDHIAETKLKDWLDRGSSRNSTHHGKIGRTRSRYILGPSRAMGQFYQSKKFPRLDCYPCNILPFSRSSFLCILRSFQLPEATQWLLASDSTHFQTYEMAKTRPSSRNLGFTMRMHSRGVIEIDISVSVSYEPKTGAVNAFLHGCTKKRQDQVARLIGELRTLAGHPLLLPFILLEMKVDLLHTHEVEIWNELVAIEKRTGHTDLPVVEQSSTSEQLFQSDQGDTRELIDEELFGLITKKVLGVIQLTTHAESHARSLLLSLQEAKKSLALVEALTNQENRDYIARVGSMLSEKLDLHFHRTQVILNDLQFIEKRAQAQQTAVYNYVAKQEAQSSGLIARLSKRDSSAMKSIAVLTMLFLPGTFLATFFAMPILEYPDGFHLPSTKASFWLYWAIAAPLTVLVFLAYIVFEFYIDRNLGKLPSPRITLEARNSAVDLEKV